MSDPSNSLRLEVVSVLRNGRRRYDPVSKQRLVEACRQPGASLAGLALRHGVNANLLRKWVTGRPGQQRAGTAVSAWTAAGGGEAIDRTVALVARRHRHRGGAAAPGAAVSERGLTIRGTPQRDC